MCEISCVVEGEDLVDSEELNVGDTVCYEHARLISCDVERTFSHYRLYHSSVITDIILRYQTLR
jgi:hypothetical protein